MLALGVTERRRRLARRHSLAAETLAPDPVSAAAGVIALHGTDPASVFLSAWARMRCGDVATVEGALYEDRTLVRVPAMRRTMFVAPVDTAAVLLAACSQEVAARERRKLLTMIAEAGLTTGDPERWLRAAEATAMEALAHHGEATAGELAGADPRLNAVLVLGAGSRFENRQKVISRVLFVLGAQGRAVRTRPKGSWTSTQFRWAALDHWQPAAAADLSPAGARTELARRWLACFGPATLADLCWWTGWTRAAARAAVAPNQIVEVDLGAGPGMVLAGDEAPAQPVEPWAALLPALDPTTMGWQERVWYLGEHGPLLFDRNGNASPTIWWDGRVVGGWAQAPDGEIRIHLLEDIGTDAVAAIQCRAADLSSRVGAAKLRPRARARSTVELRLTS